MQFIQFGLDRKLQATIEHLGFNEPTEIQAQAIPAAMAGNDLIASSKTGSGKTLAFLLPALQRLIKNRPLAKRDPRVVILTPTRELAKQVFSQLRLFTANTPFNAVLILGGENFNDQVKVLAKEPHFIVATPGRLADHLDQGHFYLHGLEMLILDEADRMLDLGFSEQLNKLNNAADHRKRQTLMFSATLDHAQLNDFALNLLKKPKRIAIDNAYTEHADINKHFYFADNLAHKEKLLFAILAKETFQQLILFTATRQDTERLSSLLAAQGYASVALSGELNQSQRNHIMSSFSKGQHQILVTTDLASRGLDLVNVSHVINFDLPKHSEEFVHRIGRTGRAGASGDAISFVGPKDWLSFNNIEAFLKSQFEFSVIAELPAKFSGIKPKKENKKADKKRISSKTKKTKHVQKVKVKQPIKFMSDDAGAMPIRKRATGGLQESDNED